MNVVRHNLHCEDFHAVLLGDLAEDGGTASRNPTFQNLPPIFRTEEDVVLAGIDDAVVRLVSGNHVLLILVEAVYVNNSLQPTYYGARLTPFLKAGDCARFVHR